MLSVKVIQSFKRRGEIIPPGTILDIPDEILPKLTDYVKPVNNVITLRRVWIENGGLRVVGVFDDLASEIVKLTANDPALQRQLLTRYCQQYGPAHFWSLVNQWEERAAIMEHDAGMTREQAEEEAAKHYHLAAWLPELRQTTN